MQDLDLVHSNSPVGLRQSDIILDTDDKRKQKYFMLMHFKDREQSDKALTYINSHQEPAESIHKSV